MGSKAQKNRKITLIIRNEDNPCMDRELMAELLPVEGGVFTAKGECSEGRWAPVKKDILEYEYIFSCEKPMEREVTEFLERFRPYFQSLQELESKGYSVDFIFRPSGYDFPNVERKLKFSKFLLQNMAEAGLNFAIALSAFSELKKNKLKKCKQLNKFERRFLRKHMSAWYCTCRVYCFGQGESKPSYRHEFVYRSDKKKRQGLRYAVGQVEERHKAGALKKPALLQVYSYHAWYSDWLWLTPKFLRRLADLKVDLEFNCYVNDFVRY